MAESQRKSQYPNETLYAFHSIIKDGGDGEQTDCEGETETIREFGTAT